MLHLYKVIYELDYDKKLPEDLIRLYGDEINSYDELMIYVLAESSSEASEMAWLSLPIELEDYFEETNVFDVQNCFMEDEFINNYQKELKQSRDNIIRINGDLSLESIEYFDKYLKEEA